MKRTYVFDACALIALLNDEPGADRVEALLAKSELDECTLFINIINVLEIYYGIYRDDGAEVAQQALTKIRELPLTIVPVISDEVFQEAGQLKAGNKISLADAIAAAEANVRNARLVTADHHEFDSLEKVQVVKLHWIR